MIYVCNKCLTASCWAGIFMCDDARSAGLYRTTRAQAKRFNLEHEDYLNLPEVVAPNSDTSTPLIPARIAREARK